MDAMLEMMRKRRFIEGQLRKLRSAIQSRAICGSYMTFPTSEEGDSDRSVHTSQVPHRLHVMHAYDGLSLCSRRQSL